MVVFLASVLVAEKNAAHVKFVAYRYGGAFVEDEDEKRLVVDFLRDFGEGDGVFSERLYGGDVAGQHAEGKKDLPHSCERGEFCCEGRDGLGQWFSRGIDLAGFHGLGAWWRAVVVMVPERRLETTSLSQWAG